MEMQEKADTAIREMLRMVRDSFNITNSSIEMLESIVKNIRNPDWLRGLSNRYMNFSEDYAAKLDNVVTELKKAMAEVESRDIDWEFKKS